MISEIFHFGVSLLASCLFKVLGHLRAKANWSFLKCQPTELSDKSDSRVNHEISFVYISTNLFLAFQPRAEVEMLAEHRLRGKNTFLILESGSRQGKNEFQPSSLSEVYRFDEAVRAAQRQFPTQNLVICAGTEQLVQLKAIFLVGCHLIMTQMKPLDETQKIMQQCKTTLLTQSPKLLNAIYNSWAAVYRAKTLDWIDFSDVFGIDQGDKGRIFIEEYIHYASPANGSLHIVVPGCFILFRSPSEGLPANCQWSDQGGMRVFSSSYYAHLLSDLGVEQVLRLDGCSGDVQPFRDFGIEVEDLFVRPTHARELDDHSGFDAAIDSDSTTSSGILRALDRFMSLARSARGPIALQCGWDEISPGGGGMGDLGHGGALVAAWMLRAGRFARADEALAWIRVTVPRPVASLEDMMLRVTAAAGLSGGGGGGICGSPRSVGAGFCGAEAASAARPGLLRRMSSRSMLRSLSMQSLRMETSAIADPPPPPPPSILMVSGESRGGGGMAAPLEARLAAQRRPIRRQGSFAGSSRCLRFGAGETGSGSSGGGWEGIGAMEAEELPAAWFVLE